MFALVLRTTSPAAPEPFAALLAALHPGPGSSMSAGRLPATGGPWAAVGEQLSMDAAWAAVGAEVTINAAWTSCNVAATRVGTSDEDDDNERH
jgi:hypothetical protein